MKQTKDPSVPRDTSMLYRDPGIAVELTQFMMSRFIGNHWHIPMQKEDGSWFPVRPQGDDNWYNSTLAHLCHNKTIGIYPCNEDKRVHTLCIDIDCHSGPFYWFDFFSDKVLPVMHWFFKNDAGFGKITEENILIENSGAGFHLWFWSEQPLPIPNAVAFLKGVAEEYDVEIFPNNPNPDGIGKLIRLPLGIHQLRKRTSRESAVSKLLAYENGQLREIYRAGDALQLLQSWKSLETRQVQCMATAASPDYFLPTKVFNIKGKLASIVRNETRPCIRHIFLHQTRIGHRDWMAFHIGRYLRHILCMSAAEVRETLFDWNRHCTEQPLPTKIIEKKVNQVMSSGHAPSCNSKVFSNICYRDGYEASCEYRNARGKVPVADKAKYFKLKKDKTALSKIELALYDLRHIKGTHPERGHGWFKVTFDDIAAKAKVAKQTVHQPIPKGQGKGLSRLEYLQQLGNIEFESKSGSKYLWVRILD